MRRVRQRLAAIALAMLIAMVGAPASADTPGPYLWVDDAPLTRNQTVALHVIDGDGEIVERRLISNTATLDANGLLADGVDFSGGDWTLAAGADGPRTIYGQVIYKDGRRINLAPLPMHLLTDAPSSLYNDMDGGQGFIQGPWRQRLTSATRRFRGSAVRSSSSGPTVGFRVGTGEWGTLEFMFARADGVALTAGTYQVDNATSAGAHANLSAHGLSSFACATATGTVTIRTVEFHAGEDLRRVDADYALICGGANRVAGTVQYGVSRQIYALSQSADRLLLGTTAVSEQSAPQSITLTNIGDLPAPLGQAVITGANASDFALAGDGCSNTSLAVGKGCSLSVRATPSARGSRFATLTLPDPTVGGQRTIGLSAAGEQPTTLTLTAPNLPATPGQATFVVTIAPPTAHLGPGFYINGEQKFGPVVAELSDPPRRSYTYTFNIGLGSHVATASFLGGDFFRPSEAAPIAFEVAPGPEPPSGSVAINGNSGYTASRDVTLSVPASHGEANLATVALSNNGTTWTERPYALTQPWTLTAGDGLKMVFVKWRDTAGRWSQVATATIFLDTTPPTASLNDVRLLTDRSITSGKVPLIVVWGGTDGGSGIERYELQRRVGSNAWKTVSRNLSGGTIELALAPQKKHTFRVRAVDRLGHVGQWAVSRQITLSRYQEDSARVGYGGSWTRATHTSYWGGALRHSSKAKSIARIEFTGRQVAWVSRLGPDRGKAEILVGGVVVETIDLSSRHIGERQVVWVGRWATSASRVVTIRVLGTSGRPRVDLDAFVTTN